MTKVKDPEANKRMELKKQRGIKLYQEGKTIREASAEAGIAYATLQRALIYAGVERRPPGGTLFQRWERIARKAASQDTMLRTLSTPVPAEQLDRLLTEVGKEADLTICGVNAGRYMLNRVDTHPEGGGRAFFTRCVDGVDISGS